VAFQKISFGKNRKRESKDRYYQAGLNYILLWNLLNWLPISCLESVLNETLRYTRARDHGFYAAREGRGDRPRVGGSVATGGPRAVTAARAGILSFILARPGRSIGFYAARSY
jgi:hypothetical protein